ncbi:hypothetical protein F5884DRAFT_467681 [Xylogone sp. PMI_703]|nr:hypothetical protein F5884DRAFT_467681 [Xylogone sp. PMI_703]
MGDIKNENGKFDYDDDGEEEEDQIDQVMDFSLELAEGAEDDEDSTYRTQNDPRRPHQRSNIVERKGALDVRCLAIDVIHGYLSPEGDPATLLVFEFRLDARKRARRIIEASMSFTFASRDKQNVSDPEVLQIAPKGRMILVPTKQQESSTYGGDANLGGGFLGASLGGSVKWEKTVSRESSDATAVVGSIDLVGRNYGASNGASWTLLENQTMATGVPALLRTAVLLRREDDESEFMATFKIQAKADVVSSLQKVFGRTPKDDPILYDPSLGPTNTLRKYDCERLGEVDLSELSAVAFTHDG